MSIFNILKKAKELLKESATEKKWYDLAEKGVSFPKNFLNDLSLEDLDKLEKIKGDLPDNAQVFLKKEDLDKIEKEHKVFEDNLKNEAFKTRAEFIERYSDLPPGKVKRIENLFLSKRKKSDLTPESLTAIVGGDEKSIKEELESIKGDLPTNVKNFFPLSNHDDTSIDDLNTIYNRLKIVEKFPEGLKKQLVDFFIRNKQQKQVETSVIELKDKIKHKEKTKDLIEKGSPLKQVTLNLFPFDERKEISAMVKGDLPEGVEYFYGSKGKDKASLKIQEAFLANSKNPAFLNRLEILKKFKDESPNKKTQLSNFLLKLKEESQVKDWISDHSSAPALKKEEKDEEIEEIKEKDLEQKGKGEKKEEPVEEKKEEPKKKPDPSKKDFSRNDVESIIKTFKDIGKTVTREDIEKEFSKKFNPDLYNSILAVFNKYKNTAEVIDYFQDHLIPFIIEDLNKNKKADFSEIKKIIAPLSESTRKKVLEGANQAKEALDYLKEVNKSEGEILLEDLEKKLSKIISDEKLKKDTLKELDKSLEDAIEFLNKNKEISAADAIQTLEAIQRYGKPLKKEITEPIEKLKDLEERKKEVKDTEKKKEIEEQIQEIKKQKDVEIFGKPLEEKSFKKINNIVKELKKETKKYSEPFEGKDNFFDYTEKVLDLLNDYLGSDRKDPLFEALAKHILFEGSYRKTKLEKGLDSEKEKLKDIFKKDVGEITKDKIEDKIKDLKKEEGKDSDIAYLESIKEMFSADEENPDGKSIVYQWGPILKNYAVANKLKDIFKEIEHLSKLENLPQHQTKEEEKEKEEKIDKLTKQIEETKDDKKKKELKEDLKLLKSTYPILDSAKIKDQIEKGERDYHEMLTNKKDFSELTKELVKLVNKPQYLDEFQTEVYKGAKGAKDKESLERLKDRLKIKQKTKEKKKEETNVLKTLKKLLADKDLTEDKLDEITDKYGTFPVFELIDDGDIKLPENLLKFVELKRKLLSILNRNSLQLDAENLEKIKQLSKEKTKLRNLLEKYYADDDLKKFFDKDVLVLPKNIKPKDPEMKKVATLNYFESLINRSPNRLVASELSDILEILKNC